MPPEEFLPQPSVRQVVVVLGMHRSGTSLVAGCLQRFGIDFGPRLMPPDADNPRGYFEHNDVVNLHDRLLLALDRRWDDPRPSPADWWRDERLGRYHDQLLAILRRDFPGTPWGLKDPRLCRLLPWWESVWRELDVQPLFLLVRRAPAGVAASLARREGMSPGKAHLLWLRHVLEAEHWTRSGPRILLDFDDVLQDEHAALAPVRDACKLPPSPAVAAPLVDPALGRPAVNADPPEIPPWVEAADAALQMGLAGRESEMRQALDEIASRLCECEPFLAHAAASETNDLLHELAATRKQARWYEEEWYKAQARNEKLQARLAIKKSSANQRE